MGQNVLKAESLRNRISTRSLQIITFIIIMMLMMMICGKSVWAISAYEINYSGDKVMFLSIDSGNAPRYAYEDDTVYFSVNLTEEHYKITGVYAGGVALNPYEGNVYSFTMPGENVTVTAIVEQINDDHEIIRDDKLGKGVYFGGGTTKAREGDPVSFSLYTSPGYSIKSITASGMDGGEVLEVKEKGDNWYTFTMIDENVFITAEAQKEGSDPDPDPDPDPKKHSSEPSKEKVVMVDNDTYKSEAPSKTVMASETTGAERFFDLKIHDADSQTIANQKLLAQILVGAKSVFLTENIYPRRDLSLTENGSLQNLTWNNLPKNQPGPISAVVYNQIDGAYVIKGVLDANGTATFAGFKLRPASTITICK